ncbi:MAG: hypothetical protein LBP59_15095 [Planctomycetaceae bacterium]|jgi:hypothetical protein|nr:hypothetical protein [Planctomycetaceae bacterium]
MTKSFKTKKPIKKVTVKDIKKAENTNFYTIDFIESVIAERKSSQAALLRDKNKQIVVLNEKLAKIESKLEKNLQEKTTLIATNYNFWAQIEILDRQLQAALFDGAFFNYATLSGNLLITIGGVVIPLCETIFGSSFLAKSLTLITVVSGVSIISLHLVRAFSKKQAKTNRSSNS